MFDEIVEQHLQYLIDSAEEFASAQSSSKYYDRFLKTVESKHFLEAQGTIDQRKSIARTHPEYLQALEDAKDVDYQQALLYAKREYAKLSISTWQSRVKEHSRTM